MYLSSDILFKLTDNELDIKGNDGTNSTLYVDGDIVNENGEFHNVDGIIKVNGNWTNTIGVDASINGLQKGIEVSHFIPKPTSNNTHLEIVVNTDTKATVIMFNGIRSTIDKSTI